MTKINLGDCVRDSVTGFEGVVTAHVVYLTGTPQFCVTPCTGLDGAWREARYFEEARLTPTKADGFGFLLVDPTASETQPSLVAPPRMVELPR